MSQAWAGKNWGSMQIPRIGQEVIVSFLEGDPVIVFIGDNLPEDSIREGFERIVEGR